MSENAISMQNKLMSLQWIISLTDDSYDVESWYDQINAWKTINNVTENKELFEFCLLKIQGLGAKKVRELITIDEDNNINYPSLDQIKSTLLKTYGIEEDVEDIMDKFKELKINEKEDLKTFNKRYYKLYSKIPEEVRKFINYKDYAGAIEDRIDAWETVMRHGKDSLETIMAMAENSEEIANRKKELLKGKKSNPASSNKNFENNKFNNKNFNNKLNNFNNSNKQTNNNSYQVGDNKTTQNFKNNNNKVLTCRFCDAIGHKKINCPEYNQYQRLHYQALLKNKINDPNEESSNSDGDHLNC